jgi:hypothetical protein
MKNTRTDMHKEIETFPELFTSDKEMSQNIGRRCRFVSPSCHAEFDMFTVCAVQTIYDGSLAYRVVGDKDNRRFGRPARANEIKFL